MGLYYSIELGAPGYKTKVFVIPGTSLEDATSSAHCFLADKLHEIYFANKIPLDVPLDVLKVVEHELTPTERKGFGL